MIGYERISASEIVNLMNNIYQNEHRQMINFFYATMKLEKVKKLIRVTSINQATPLEKF